MITLLTILLILAFAAIVAYLVWLIVRPDEPDPVDLDRPLVAPAADIDAATEPFYWSRHHEDTVEIVDPNTYQAPLYSAGFAAAIGLGREADR